MSGEGKGEGELRMSGERREYKGIELLDEGQCYLCCVNNYYCRQVP